MSEESAAELLSRVEAELAGLELASFTHDDAWRLGTIAREIAVAEGLGVAIRVTRGAQIAFQGTTAGSSADNDDWMSKKIRTVERLETASLVLRLRREVRGSGFEWLDPATYAIAGGCVPIRVAGGALVGTITVSGLKDVDDHALAVRALRGFLAG